MGAGIFEGHKAEQVHGAHVVVISSAVRRDNPEVAEALRRKILETGERPDGRRPDEIREINQRSADILGYTLEELKNQLFSSLWFDDAQEAKFTKGAGVLAVPGVSGLQEMPGENPRFTAAQLEAEKLLQLKKDAFAAEELALRESLQRGEITEGEYLTRRKQAYQIAFQGTTIDVIEGLSQMADAFGKFGKESKALTLFQIGLDTASAISSLVKMSEANPANTVTFGAAGMIQFATGLVRIFANIMMARKVIMGGKYTGGEIGADDGVMLSHPTPHGDNMLIVAKEGEVVLNEHQQSYFGKEAFRSAGVPGFAGGGMIGASGINFAQGGGFDVNNFVNKLASMLGGQKIYLQLNELTDASKKYAEIRSGSEL
jgi:hypothetical protein